MQVWISIITLDAISGALNSIQYASTGVGYITENVDGVDYILASSTLEVTDASGNRLPPAQSTSSKIRKSWTIVEDLQTATGSHTDLQDAAHVYKAPGKILEGVCLTTCSAILYSNQL